MTYTGPLWQNSTLSLAVDWGYEPHTVVWGRQANGDQIILSGYLTESFVRVWARGWALYGSDRAIQGLCDAFRVEVPPYDQRARMALGVYP